MHLSGGTICVVRIRPCPSSLAEKWYVSVSILLQCHKLQFAPLTRKVAAWKILPGLWPAWNITPDHEKWEGTFIPRGHEIETAFVNCIRIIKSRRELGLLLLWAWAWAWEQLCPTLFLHGPPSSFLMADCRWEHDLTGKKKVDGKSQYSLLRNRFVGSKCSNGKNVFARKENGWTFKLCIAQCTRWPDKNKQTKRLVTLSVVCSHLFTLII